MTDVLHIHGQPAWHEAAVIVGNGSALARLRDLITTALESGAAEGNDFFVADGEGYEVVIRLRPEPFGSDAWDSCRLPYTGRIARERRRNVDFCGIMPQSPGQKYRRAVAKLRRKEDIV